MKPFKSDSYVRDALNKLIEENDLPKAVQGDSGHAQSDTVTDTYSHIIDNDREKNAELIEKVFCTEKEPRQGEQQTPGGTILQAPKGVDADVLEKVLVNLEMMALLASLVKTMGDR